MTHPPAMKRYRAAHSTLRPGVASSHIHTPQPHLLNATAAESKEETVLSSQCATAPLSLPSIYSINAITAAFLSCAPPSTT